MLSILINWIPRNSIFIKSHRIQFLFKSQGSFFHLSSFFEGCGESAHSQWQMLQSVQVQAGKVFALTREDFNAVRQSVLLLTNYFISIPCNFFHHDWCSVRTRTWCHSHLMYSLVTFSQGLLRVPDAGDLVAQLTVDQFKSFTKS